MMHAYTTAYTSTQTKQKQSTPADLEERKTSQMEVWKGCMAKLKKAARWGSAGKAKGGGRKKSRGGGGGGDTASVASTGSGATAGAGAAAGAGGGAS